VSIEKEETNGVYVASTQSEAAPVAVISGKGKYQKLTWDEEQTEIAFVSDRDDADSKQPKFKIYLWARGGNPTVREGANAGRMPALPGVSANNHTNPAAPTPAIEIVSSASPGFRKDFVVSDKANLSFSLDGSRLFLGAAPPPAPEKNADEEVSADEKVIADLWHWKDDYIQPIQRVRAEQERQRSYRAVYLTKEKRFVQLADESMENINPSIDGRFAVGADNRAYRIESDHNPGHSDYYVINASDGSRKAIRQKQRGGVSLSPGAKYAIFFDGKDWNSYSVADARVVNLTKSLGVNFFNEDNDTPDLPGSYGWRVGRKTTAKF